MLLVIWDIRVDQLGHCVSHIHVSHGLVDIVLSWLWKSRITQQTTDVNLRPTLKSCHVGALLGVATIVTTRVPSPNLIERVHHAAFYILCLVISSHNNVGCLTKSPQDAETISSQNSHYDVMYYTQTMSEHHMS